MTIAPELQARILRLYQVEKWRINTIAHQLHVHHTTVMRVLAQAGVAMSSIEVRPSVVDPYVPFIIATLKQYPTLPRARLYMMVRERGYRGSAISSVTAWRCCVHVRRPRLTCDFACCQAR